MENLNELTHEEMQEINGGGFDLGLFEAAYDFVKGACQGFVDRAKQMPHTWE